MKSQYVKDLERLGKAKNDHGITISTVEQSGSLAGDSCGRLWINFNDRKGAVRWHWISCDSIYQAKIEAVTLKSLTPEQIREKYEL